MYKCKNDLQYINTAPTIDVLLLNSYFILKILCSTK